MKYEKFKKLRKEKNLSQGKLASILNITQIQYARYERGKKKVPSEIIIELSKF